MDEQKIVKLEDAMKFEEKFRKNEFPHQRWGQAFCNYFSITCPEIFYQEDKNVAIVFAYFNFVDYGEMEKP